MRDVKYTTRFQRDYRREKSGRHSKKLDALLMEVVNLLAADTPLPRRNFDHPLSGEWNDHRDCHIRPDLVLIYRKPDDGTRRRESQSGMERASVPAGFFSLVVALKAGGVFNVPHSDFAAVCPACQP